MSAGQLGILAVLTLWCMWVGATVGLVGARAYVSDGNSGFLVVCYTMWSETSTDCDYVRLTISPFGIVIDAALLTSCVVFASAYRRTYSQQKPPRRGRFSGRGA